MTATPPPGPTGPLEAEDDPAGELELVRVLGVPDRVAAPVGVAPVALGVRLDVRGRPASLETEAEVPAREQLQAGRPGGRELRLAADVPRGGVEAAVLRRAQAAQDVGPGRGVGVAEVVGEVAVVVVDGLRDAPVDDARGLEVRRLRGEQEPELHVRRQVEAEAGAPGERVLGTDLDRRVVDRANVDTVTERPARGAADLDPGILRLRRGRGHQAKSERHCHLANHYSVSSSENRPPRRPPRRPVDRAEPLHK